MHRAPPPPNASRVHTTASASPLGPLTLAATEAGLVGVHFPTHRHSPPWHREGSAADAGGAPPAVVELLRETAAQIDEYFSRRRVEFDLPIAAEGTLFQQRVWSALRAIPFGETISYGELARRVGDPGAARAVGSANAHNPVSIIVPCHRVVGHTGSLTGYGGGMERKRWLLVHEGALARDVLDPAGREGPNDRSARWEPAAF